MFLPGMRKELKPKYEECNQCQEYKQSKAQAHNEISSKDLFKNFLPLQRLEVDFAEKGNQNYAMIVDVLTGFRHSIKPQINPQMKQ